PPLAGREPHEAVRLVRVRGLLQAIEMESDAELLAGLLQPALDCGDARAPGRGHRRSGADRASAAPVASRRAARAHGRGSACPRKSKGTRDPRSDRARAPAPPALARRSACLRMWEGAAGNQAASPQTPTRGGLPPEARLPLSP